VLHFHQTESQIFLYISKQVQLNVFNPILQQKHQISNIICKHSRQRRQYSIHDRFKVIQHVCTRHSTLIYIAALNKPNPESLKVFSSTTGSKKYYGLKNMTMKKYTETNLHEIVKVYLM